MGKADPIAPALSRPVPMGDRVVIVGGGLAGLAAAVALGQGGLAVTLCESRGRFGGRASSFVDQATGEQLDNCQHVALGCCTNFLHFCRTTGLDGTLCCEEQLLFVGPGNESSRFAASSLPAPLHLFPAFARLTFLSWGDKWRLGQALRSLAQTDPASCGGECFLDWLKRHRQSPAAIERFWHVVLVSALSETLDRIGVAHARKVFVDAFLRHRDGWTVWIPTAPLDELYGKELARWFEKQHVVTHLNARVARIIVQPKPTAVRSGREDNLPEPIYNSNDDFATGVELRTGEFLSADHVVLAVPPHLVGALLPEAWRSRPEFASLAQLETAPISSVHLWYDRPITELRHATFVGRKSQWLFNRSELQGAGGRGGGQRSEVRGQSRRAAEGQRDRRTERQRGSEAEGHSGRATEPQTHRETGSQGDSGTPPTTHHSLLTTHYYQIVISASRDVVERPQEETIRAVVAELADVFPPARAARLVHARVVSEHKAVLSMLPGVDALRPAQQTSIAIVYLAGDYTNTGWPGTMEGAVRSGYLAAECVLRNLRRAEPLLQADLPTARLSRFLFGL